MSLFRQPVARVAFNMSATQTSWGGGNQWLLQMTRFLRDRGYAVSSSLKPPLDAIVIVHSGHSSSVTFDAKEIHSYRRRYPQTKCLHRVNENDQRKGTNYMDKLLETANDVADYTVFISQWLRDYYAARWFDSKRAYTVINNGADSTAFHPYGSAEYSQGGLLRLVTHHWSDHWMKGFALYQEIDRLIADGKLPKTELWVIGRWPKSIDWQAARTFKPTTGVRLAALLRSCHAYVTASLWEPGGMHFVEGAQCGLPVLFHLDGGGIVEEAQQWGLGFREDVRSAILSLRESYPLLRRAVIQNAPSGDAMCLAFERVIRKMILGQLEKTPQPIEQAI